MPSKALFACLAGLFLCGCQAASGLDPLEARLEKLRSRWHVPGMSAAIVQEGRVIWSHGFGSADVENKTPATPETVYHLASLTKPFAATVLLQLVEEGRLNLDAPVSEFGIELAGEGVVRVRHLLNHTSEGVPGEKFRYSGNRFALLDKVIDGVTGRGFAAELQHRILDPLELENTCPNPLNPPACKAAGRDPTVYLPRLAAAYDLQGKPLNHPTYFVTAAGLVSTVADVAKFSEALDDGRLLRPESLALAYTPETGGDGKPLAYGLGWFVQPRESGPIVWHYGWGVGNSTLIIKAPHRKLTFILLGNSEGLSRKFDMGRDNNVLRSPFARAFIEALGL